MKQMIIRCACMVALAATPGAKASAAEWTLLPGPASSGVAVYTDVETQRDKHVKLLGYVIGNPVRAWYLSDYQEPQRWLMYDIQSSKQHLEFNCRDVTMRLLSRLYYPGHMGQGRVLATEREARDFTAVVPGQPEETMLRAVCVKPETMEVTTSKAATASAPAQQPPAP